MRRRSRERLLQATLELVDERGYEATTLADIADRAGTARGLVSYYFPGKRPLVQSAVHRLMHLTLAAALEREPRSEDADERMARAVDAILGLTASHATVMRTHMASILQHEGFIQCPEQQKLAALLQDTVARRGPSDPAAEYRLLRALLMGAVVALLLPGAPMPLASLRAELFQRYGLDWKLGVPPEGDPPRPWRPVPYEVRAPDADDCGELGPPARRRGGGVPGPAETP
ncbi:TetR family transcriptional regulator [Streptantibioticus cattleyicolor NRRL 8057 = DSM 46488]|uniref:TetR family transcriptional regulator n=1 Tax=Streptantibioticus cattleyicolor (strain ATCC 35852 / DSM 46488 / JCM 4925 / NBRC 14057 / NRRL 8057) TaxID=1003195 RepID=F8JW45_STREN|nr:TetR family transcriptional regulator [Streptantibioticus cattleyicolor NRRL 8057 = DSM 46488]MYS57937.1 TetR family transcriptional regulator [Streptomyces sp. SID5468]CCB73576.1 TetR-family transcriptional regulatory protein [Streptantibioticus cattleyicolor NRRL 8057 = DSM 46488]